MTKRKHTPTVSGVKLVGERRRIVRRSEERTSIENVDYAMFLEHRRWRELRPQDRGGRVKVKNEKYELSRRAVL